MKWWSVIIVTLVIAGGTGLAVKRFGNPTKMIQARTQKRTVADRLAEFGETARNRLKPHFTKAGVPYPPERATLLVLKEERRLEIYVLSGDGMRFVCSYPILGASGGPGPKLREGDKQVPEGIYRVELLNPNSLYHVSLRVGYPNEFDRAQAAREGRTNLGGDIMIHGGSGSIGCVAVGDPVSEEIFTLAADGDFKKLTILSVPHDFRRKPIIKHAVPEWMHPLYEQLRAELRKLPAQ